MPSLRDPSSSISRRGPAAAAAPTVSTASIALAAVGATALVIALTVVSVVYFRARARKRRAPSASATFHPQTSQIPQASPQTLLHPSNARHLAVGQPEDERSSTSIANLPISDSSSSLASSLAGRQEDAKQREGPSREVPNAATPARLPKAVSPPPFGGPSFVSVSTSRGQLSAKDRTSAQFWRQPDASDSQSGKDAGAPSRVSIDLLRNLEQLPSHPAPATTKPLRPSRRGSGSSTAESEALTPVLDEGIQYRIASGIFGDSLGSDIEKHMWLSNILDSALGPSSRSTSPQKSRASLGPGGKGRAGGSSSRRGSLHPRPTEPLPLTPASVNLSKSASVNSFNSASGSNRRNSARIPVSRSQKLYESQGPPTAAYSGQDLASYPSTSDVSSSSHHLSTIRSRAPTEFTAATSLPSSDSLVNALESDAFIFKADKAQKMPAKTMTTSQVINVTSRSSRKGKGIGSSLDTSAFSRSETKNEVRRGESPATDLRVAAVSPSLAAPFATTFHRAVFPDSPAAGRQQVKAETPTLLPSSSLMLAALSSSSPIKGNPKMGLAAQLKSKLSRAVASPTLSTPQLNYVKSSSALNLSMPNTPKESSSPNVQDVSPDTSIVRQEEWRINTDDSNDQLLATVKRTSSDDRSSMPRQSGLGIDGVETLEEDAMVPDRRSSVDVRQPETIDTAGDSQTEVHAAEPRSPTPSQWSMQDQSRQAQKGNSPIMQQDRWAKSPPMGQGSCRQSQFSRDSPSLYEDADAKSFAGHSVTVGTYDTADSGAFGFASNFSPRMTARGVMSPLDRFDRSINHDRQWRQGSLQTTPVMSSGRFPGQSPSGLSPHSVVRTGSAKYRQVGEGVTHEYSHRGYSFASPRSDGGADMMSASSCGIPETEEMGGAMSSSDQAAATRAKLLQSVQRNLEREESQETVRLEEHLERERSTLEEDKRMLTESEGANKRQSHGGQRYATEDPQVARSVTNEIQLEAERSPRGSHVSKKPAGLSIYVASNKVQQQQQRGKPKLGLGMGVVSPMTPPYTPSTTDKTSIESRRSEVLLSMMGMTGHSVQQDTVEELPHEEGDDTITELVSEGISRTCTPGPATPGQASPFKLRPLSLSTSGSVLGAEPSPEVLAAASPTKNALGFSPALNLQNLEAANIKRGSYFPSSESGTMTPSPSTSSRELFLPGHVQSQAHLQPQTPLSGPIAGGSSPALKRASYRVSNSFTSGFGLGSAGSSQPSTPLMKPYAQAESGQAAMNASRSNGFGSKRGSFAYHSSTIVPSLSSGGASGGPLLYRAGADLTPAAQASGIAA